jgi:hypothetical protein
LSIYVTFSWQVLSTASASLIGNGCVLQVATEGFNWLCLT